MAPIARALVGVVVLAGLAGCASNGALGAGPVGQAAANAAAGLPPSANAMILQREQLDAQQGQTVLDVMRADLPAVHIMTAATDCPSLAMRGPNVSPGVNEPTVYLDGQPSSNTCLLEELPANQVARVEIYPMGSTPRPGYDPNSSGLILLFSRRASDDVGTTALQH